MPQASGKTRWLMLHWFGDEILDTGPLKFLEARGWTFLRGRCKPPVKAYTPSYYELACIDFLCCEWDYTYKGIYDPMDQYMEDGLVAFW